MSTQMFFVGILLLVFLYAWYSANKLQNQIHCSYRRVDKTIIEKFTKRHSKYVIFDGAKYEIIPDRISLIRWKRGIHQFLPIWVQHLDYTWDNAYPQDPSKYQNTIVSPEVRNLINQEARMAAFSKGVRDQGVGKKASGLMQYLPLIALGGVIIALFIIYTMSQKINLIEQMMKVGK